jgi:TonB family protein
LQATDPDLYLDECADLVWEALLKPARDNLPKDRRDRAAMTYVKELSAKPLPGREYSITLGDLTGTIQFYVAQTRIYVLMAVNSPVGLWARERFLSSFTVSPNLPMQLPDYGEPIGAGIRGPSSDATDDNRVFRSSEVTQRARVLEKREPSYTEAARKYSITGTVVLRAVFSKNGEVTNLHIIRKLPHGLTQQALKAAREIRFTPALKDGQPVSMWMQLEYNFNLY